MPENRNNNPSQEPGEQPLSCLIGYGIGTVLFALFFATFILAIHGGGH